MLDYGFNVCDHDKSAVYLEKNFSYYCWPLKHFTKNFSLTLGKYFWLIPTSEIYAICIVNLF